MTSISVKAMYSDSVSKTKQTNTEKKEKVLESERNREGRFKGETNVNFLWVMKHFNVKFIMPHFWLLSELVCLQRPCRNAGRINNAIECRTCNRAQ